MNSITGEPAGGFNERLVFAACYWLATVLLALAVFSKMPYGYYKLLRFAVSGAAIFCALKAYDGRRQPWLFLAGAIALVFNPVVPIPFSRGVWEGVDFLTALLIPLMGWRLSMNTRGGSVQPRPSVAQEAHSQRALQPQQLPASFFREPTNIAWMGMAIKMAERTQYAYDWWQTLGEGPQLSNSGLLASHSGFTDLLELRQHMLNRSGKLVGEPPPWMAGILCISKKNEDALISLPNGGTLPVILKGRIVQQFAIAMRQPRSGDFQEVQTLGYEIVRQLLFDAGIDVTDSILSNVIRKSGMAKSAPNMMAAEMFPIMEFSEGVQAEIVLQSIHMNDLQARQSGLRKLAPGLYAEVMSGLYQEPVYIPLAAWDKYFSDNGRTTAQALMLGATYEEAKLTGSNLQIPMGIFLEESMDRYRIGLAKDIKFHFEAPTANEIEARALERQANPIGNDKKGQIFEKLHEELRRASSAADGGGP